MSFWKGIGSAVIGGLGSILGGQLANSANADQAQQTAEFNAAEAEKNREFQADMSNSAYQRASKDMLAAGINPIMAYSQGGASTPSGSAATRTPAQMGDVLGKGISTALEARRLRREIENTDSQVSLNYAAENAKRADEQLSKNSAKVADWNATALATKLPAIKAQADLDEKRAKIDSKLVEFDALNDRAAKTTGTLGNLSSMFKPFGGKASDNMTNYYLKKLGANGK